MCYPGDTGENAVTGCDRECALLEGWSCAGNKCDECGNGQKKADEQCDDGNKADNDGCSSKCTIEKGYVCVDSAEGESSCLPGDEYQSTAQQNLITETKYYRITLKHEVLMLLCC